MVKILDKDYRVIAIVAAAGKGQRLKSSIPKPFLKIKNKPVLSILLGVLSRQAQIKEIIIVANKDILRSVRKLVEKGNFSKVKHVVLGAATRKGSVRNGLKALKAGKDTFVLIHDAARPFINKSHIDELIRQAFKYNAVISAVPVKFTLKRARIIRNNPFVEETLERKFLWEVHTPQVFRSDLLKKAFSRFGYLDVTDDATLMEKIGVCPKIVRGSYANIKITTAEDLKLAQNLARHFRWDR